VATHRLYFHDAAHPTVTTPAGWEVGNIPNTFAYLGEGTDDNPSLPVGKNTLRLMDGSAGSSAVTLVADTTGLTAGENQWLRRWAFSGLKALMAGGKLVHGDVLRFRWSAACSTAGRMGIHIHAYVARLSGGVYVPIAGLGNHEEVIYDSSGAGHQVGSWGQHFLSAKFASTSASKVTIEHPNPIPVELQDDDILVVQMRALKYGPGGITTTIIYDGATDDTGLAEGDAWADAASYLEIVENDHRDHALPTKPANAVLNTAHAWAPHVALLSAYQDDPTLGPINLAPASQRNGFLGRGVVLRPTDAEISLTSDGYRFAPADDTVDDFGVRWLPSGRGGDLSIADGTHIIVFIPDDDSVGYAPGESHGAVNTGAGRQVAGTGLLALADEVGGDATPGEFQKGFGVHLRQARKGHPDTPPPDGSTNSYDEFVSVVAVHPYDDSTFWAESWCDFPQPARPYVVVTRWGDSANNAMLVNNGRETTGDPVPVKTTAGVVIDADHEWRTGGADRTKNASVDMPIPQHFYGTVAMEVLLVGHRASDEEVAAFFADPAALLTALPSEPYADGLSFSREVASTDDQIIDFGRANSVLDIASVRLSSEVTSGQQRLTLYTNNTATTLTSAFAVTPNRPTGRWIDLGLAGHVGKDIRFSLSQAVTTQVEIAYQRVKT